VTHTGSFNQHFIRDIGLIQMFLGTAFGVGMTRPASRLDLWARGNVVAYRACRFAPMGGRSRYLLSIGNSSRFSRCHSPGFDWRCPYGVGLGQSSGTASPDVNEFDGKRVLVTRPEEVAGLVPLERLGTPEDIAAAVSFLAGPDGSWINGQVLRVNGGMV
jgi:hypothetical protein